MSRWPAASSGCHGSAQASSHSSAPWVSTSLRPAPAATACSCPPSPVGTWWRSPDGRTLPAGSSDDSSNDPAGTGVTSWRGRAECAGGCPHCLLHPGRRGAKLPLRIARLGSILLVSILIALAILDG